MKLKSWFFSKGRRPSVNLQFF